MPEITQNFTVPFPREQVWRVFQDPARVVTCMPGASLTAPPSDGKLAGQMRVKLGPISAVFAGEADLSMNDADWAGHIRGQGLDRKNNSRAKADVGFTLREQPGGTIVDIKVDFTLTGILAQFSRGAIVQEIGRRLTEEFARCLAAEMASGAPPQPVGPVGAPEPPPAAPSPPVRDLNAGALLWSIIVGWIRRIFGARRH